MALDIGLFRTTTRRWRIGLINGPNMPNLHNRSPKVYGPSQTIQKLEERVTNIGDGLGVDILPFHSNFDGEILEWLHKNAFNGSLHGIIINPAGMNIYGEHARHCLEDSGLPYVEVHFSNIVVRKLNSVFTDTAVGICHGLRKHSYTAALVAMAGFLDDGDFVRPINYREPSQESALG